MVNSKYIKDKLIDTRAKAIAPIEQKINDLKSQIEVLQQSADKDSTTYRPQNFLASETELVVKMFNGLKVYLDPRDIAVTPHITLDGIWEEPITKAWLSVMKHDYTVFDIGANFGYFGLLAANLARGKNSKIILFEANPNLIPYINKSFSVNWLNEQTILENLGISDKKGTAHLNILQDYIGCSSLHTVDKLEGYLQNKMHIEAAEVIKVDTLSVDEYCKVHKIDEINLIKLDIEGFEEKAYRGMSNIVKQSSDLILFIEFTKNGYEDPEGFYNQMLKDFGNVNLIGGSGEFIEPSQKDYNSVLGNQEDWEMLVFSKKKLN
jgi:FkbM family methyltransferase